MSPTYRTLSDVFKFWSLRDCLISSCLLQRYGWKYRGFIAMDLALWRFNGERLCTKVDCWSETPPAPDAYLQWSLCLAFIFVRWKPMLLLLRNFSNRYGQASRTNGGIENIMRPVWDTASVMAGHLDGVSCRWVCELSSSPNACRRSGTAPDDRRCL